MLRTLPNSFHLAIMSFSSVQNRPPSFSNDRPGIRSEPQTHPFQHLQRFPPQPQRVSDCIPPPLNMAKVPRFSEHCGRTRVTRITSGHPPPPPPPPRTAFGRTQSLPSLSKPPPPPPPHLFRQRSYSSLSRPYRSRTGQFLSQHLDAVDESDPEDVAEMVLNMHIQERDYYAPPWAYFCRLEKDPVLAYWRRGAFQWFSRVVQHMLGNREIIPMATNFLDRYLAASLYPHLTGPYAASHPSPVAPWRPMSGEGLEAEGECSPALGVEHGWEGQENFGRVLSAASPSLGQQDGSDEVPVPAVLADERTFEKVAVCALILALKMQQGDSTVNVARKLTNLTSACHLSQGALCAMEFRMMGALGRYLNPPTPGTLIHHLLHFLPARRENRALFLVLDDHANDLALMALETPELVRFPVSIIAVAAILASFGWVRSCLKGEGAGAMGGPMESGHHGEEELSPGMEMEWLQTLDAKDLKIDWEEAHNCLEVLAREAKKAAALPDRGEGWGGSIYLPQFLALPPALFSQLGGRPTCVPHTPAPCAEVEPGAQMISPSGVEDIGVVEQASLYPPGAPLAAIPGRRGKRGLGARSDPGPVQGLGGQPLQGGFYHPPVGSGAAFSKGCAGKETVLPAPHGLPVSYRPSLHVPHVQRGKHPKQDYAHYLGNHPAPPPPAQAACLVEGRMHAMPPPQNRLEASVNLQPQSKYQQYQHQQQQQRWLQQQQYLQQQQQHWVQQQQRQQWS